MERRRYDRKAVKLNVALVDERAMPRGCRVRDVSQGGMLLQFEHQGAATGTESGDAVKIRLSVRDGDERRVLLLPATVRRVEENVVGVEFIQPQTELMQLIAPYRLDREQAGEIIADTTQRRVASGDTETFVADHPARFHHRDPNVGARLAERIAAARESIRSSSQAAAGYALNAGTQRTTGGDRKLFQLGLVLMGLAAAIVVYNLASRASVERRLGDLESALHQQAEALAGMKIRLTAGSGWETRVADLNARLSKLAVAVSSLEIENFSPTPAPTGKSPANRPRTGSQQPDASHAEPAADTGTATAPVRPSVQTSDGKGPWVINLVSLHDQAAADQFVRKAQSAGIAVEQARVEVKGQQVWRLQISGFASRDQASAFGDANKARLGVKNVWIFKR